MDSKHAPYATARTHRGLTVIFNPANGMEFVTFKGFPYTLEIIDRVMDECVRNAASDMLAALKRISAGDEMKASYGTWTHADTVLEYQKIAAQAAAKAEGTA